MNHAFSDYAQRAMSPADVVKLIPNGANCFLHGGAATPTAPTATTGRAGSQIPNRNDTAGRARHRTEGTTMTMMNHAY